MKNITVVIGSPRKNGNTEMLANAFVKGAKEAGNTVDIISLTEHNIKGCLGCNYCLNNEEHQCVHKDDMTEIYKRLAVADVLVFATPIYFYGASAQIKCLIDRLHNPIRKSFKVKKLVLLAVGADTIDAVFESVKLMYKSILKYFSLEDGGIITAGGVKDKGDIAGSKALNEAYNVGLFID